MITSFQCIFGRFWSFFRSLHCEMVQLFFFHFKNVSFSDPCSRLRCCFTYLEECPLSPPGHLLRLRCDSVRDQVVLEGSVVLVSLLLPLPLLLF